MVCSKLGLHRELTQWWFVMIKPTRHTPPLYYYTLWYYYLLEKTYQKKMSNLGVRNLYTHTMIANRWMNNWYKFCLHSVWHWNNYYLKLLYLLIKNFVHQSWNPLKYVRIARLLYTSGHPCCFRDPRNGTIIAKLINVPFQGLLIL